MSNKHTPGPWEVADSPLYTSVVCDYGDICDLVQDHRSAEENLANARLIKESPDLLKALKDICDTHVESHEDAYIMKDIAMAAIAKFENKEG